MKYGVIGTGWIAEAFVKGANSAEDINLTAIYSRTKEKGLEFGKKFSCTNIYTDINTFAKSDDFDSVYIASPNAFHYEQSRLMLLNGKNVICEKPATVTPKELKALYEIAEKNGLVFLEAMMMAYNPVSEKIVEAIKSIGKIFSVHFDFSQLSSKYPAYKNGELPNIFNPKMATGALMDLGCYCVYAADYFFGMPKSIEAHSVFLESGADAVTNAILSYNSMDVVITCSKVGQDYCGSQIIGELGTVKIESISKLINVDVVYNCGKKINLCADVPKERLMQNEAETFRNLISDLDINKYDKLKKCSLETCILMEKIREISGIEF